MIVGPQEFSGKNVLTIAVCGSAKKHRQSFEALKRTAVRHNTALRQANSFHGAFALKDICYDVDKSAEVDLTGLDSVSGVNVKSSSTSMPMPPCFFRFVSLNYDDKHQRMVLGRAFDVTEDSMDEGASFFPSMRGGNANHERDLDDEYRRPNQRLLQTHSVISDAYSNGGESSLMGENSMVSSVHPEEVDIILHKVTTYGIPEATRALHEWCDNVRKIQMSLKRPLLIVLDPINKMQVLTMRSMVYKLLDNVDDSHHSLALIPRTFLWELYHTFGIQKCPEKVGIGASIGAASKPAVTRMCTSSSVLDTGETHKSSASQLSGDTWWVAKPDECTGPSYTHDLVIWKSSNADVCVPPEIQAALASEPSAYVIQEFYTYAFPVVVKVYCVGPDIFIKVKPTNKLLSFVLGQVDSKDGFDRPVKINSQNKAFFSLDGLSLLATGPFGRVQRGSPPHCGAGVHQEAPLSCSVPTRLWEAFFAPGTSAWTAIARLVKELSSRRGLGLSLYGFDILLVPSPLAHSYQLKAYPKGIGYTEGSTVSYQPSPVTPSITDPHHPESMFDLRTGAPTTYLMGSVPVVIDVNYFPGYAGMEVAMRGILKVMWKSFDNETPTGGFS
ncbi:unnamed protein product [Phytomonas sp. EM1]|nr:unnamed protein product [Phytomonas sp. EM1]|eukprot:CCW62628.1 unnamed protein product [Phytomonas sp. isolate EM1]